MFSKPMRLMAMGIAVFVALLIGAAALGYLGLGHEAIFWIALGTAAVASSLVAAMDPTYREGYHFWLGIGALSMWYFLLSSSPAKGIALSGVCFAAMWVTYRIRHWRNSRRPVVDIGRYRRWRQGDLIPPM